MKTDFLKGLNLSQEVIDKIMAENGEDISAEQKKAEKRSLRSETATS